MSPSISAFHRNASEKVKPEHLPRSISDVVRNLESSSECAGIRSISRKDAPDLVGSDDLPGDLNETYPGRSGVQGGPPFVGQPIPSVQYPGEVDRLRLPSFDGKPDREEETKQAPDAAQHESASDLLHRLGQKNMLQPELLLCLLRILDLNKHGVYDRNSLIRELHQRNHPITEGKMKAVLRTLREAGLIHVGSTKQGSRISGEGKALLDSLPVPHGRVSGSTRSL